MTGRRKQMHLFERTVGGKYRAPVSVGGLDDPAVRGQLDDATFHKTRRGTGDARTRRAKSLTMPPCWRARPRRCFSAAPCNNFGVQLLLDGFLKHSPAAASRA